MRHFFWFENEIYKDLMGSFHCRARSVADSVSENLLHNISIKNRTAESKNDQDESSSAWYSNTNPSFLDDQSQSYLIHCSFLRESLQLQHSTNLNIQRSQSTQRFASNSNIGIEENNAAFENTTIYDDSNIGISASATDSNYIENSNFYGKSI